MIIAFGHQKRRGKDTAMRFLNVYLRQICPRLVIQHKAFAHELKDTAHRLYSWAGVQNWQYYESNPIKIDVVLPEIGKSVRQIWIEVGMALRSVYSETWIQKCLRDCDPKRIYIITDLRFPNEAVAVKKANGILIKITRPGLEEPSDIADTALNDFTGWDLTIQNDGGLDLLNDRICQFGSSIKDKVCG